MSKLGINTPSTKKSVPFSHSSLFTASNTITFSNPPLDANYQSRGHPHKAVCKFQLGSWLQLKVKIPKQGRRHATELHFGQVATNARPRPDTKRHKSTLLLRCETRAGIPAARGKRVGAGSPYLLGVVERIHGNRNNLALQRRRRSLYGASQYRLVPLMIVRGGNLRF